MSTTFTIEIYDIEMVDIPLKTVGQSEGKMTVADKLRALALIIEAMGSEPVEKK